MKKTTNKKLNGWRLWQAVGAWTAPGALIHEFCYDGYDGSPMIGFTVRLNSVDPEDTFFFPNKTAYAAFKRMMTTCWDNE